MHFCISIVSILFLFVLICDPAAAAESAQTVQMPVLTEKMRTYSHTKYALYFGGILYTLITFFIILQSGLSAKFRDIAESISAKLVIQAVIYSALLCCTLFAMSLPFFYGGGFWLDHQYGLSDQTLSSWFSDKLKGLSVSICLTAISLSIFIFVVRKFSKHWPLILWLLAIPLFAFDTFAEPLIVDPLFNKFSPMQRCSLKDGIDQLAKKVGIEHATILVADKSKQTKKLNAYVTGIGSSARIVLWDTTIKSLPEDQVLAVVGHEMGHYVLMHIYVGFGICVVVTFLLVPLGYRFGQSFVAILPKSWRIGSLSDVAIGPAIMLLAVSCGFISSPVINAISRAQEHAADRFGLEQTGNRLAMARLFVSLSEQNLSEPDPPALIKFWMFSHPTLKERIDYALGL